MKKSLLLFLAITVAGLSGWQVSSQTTAAFKTVVKSPSVSAHSTPQQVQPIQSMLPLKNRSLPNNATFIPRQINPSGFRLNPAVFTETRYDAAGRLLFTEGRLPDATALSLKSSEQISMACFQYLEAIKKPLGIQSPEKEFIVKNIETDELGMNHIRMQQVIEGIPVYGGEAYLHSRNGIIDRFNGYVYPSPKMESFQPKLTQDDASGITEKDVATKTQFITFTETEQAFLNYSAPVSELVIYHKGKETNRERLAWHVTVRPNIIERWEYFIDAKNGEVIHFYNNTHSDGDVLASGTDLNGVNRNFHVYLEAGTYYMVDITKPMFVPSSFEGVIKTYNANNQPYNQIQTAAVVSSANNTWAANAISAHYHAVLSYDYWMNTHNRNSYNGQGASIPSVINITDENGQGFDNAFWNGSAMFYGNGGTEFKPLAGGLDVCAHELGHAVDETSANLEYQNQSGAINESFSDIIGAMVERRNWLMGEDIIKPGNPNYPSGAMRDMSNPHNGGTSFNDASFQPAHMNELYTGNQDNGGVHINSGVPNFAYYKYATAVGLDKGEKTFMKALFNYLTRSSQFIDLRIAVIQSAKDLYGNGSAEVTAAAQAFDQVGITDGSSSGGEGTTAPGNLPVNPGQDYILLYDLYSGDQNTLFISNTAGNEFVPISETGIKNKPSILDDGSTAVFIGEDSKMYSIALTGQFAENVIQSDAIWDGVSASKDGSLISAITTDVDSSIYVYSFSKQEWGRFHLYNPGTQQGVNTYNVLYADAMEWLYDGQYLMYDAYSELQGPQGQTIDYWDINFIRVWDKAANNWGDGQIFKLMTGLEEGISIGNPSLTKNSTYIAAFDMFDANTNADYILAVNLDNGDIGQVYSNGSTLGTPNYSKLDDNLIFTTNNGGQEDIAMIGMQPDKIHPNGNPVSLIPEAKWGIWFAQGVRSLGVNDKEDARKVQIYPNPSSGKFFVNIEKLSNEPVTVTVFNLQGKMVYMDEMNSQGSRVNPDLTSLNPGLYLIQVTGKDFSVSSKVSIE
jgi:bacillolysin